MEDTERELRSILRVARKNLQLKDCCANVNCPCPVNVTRQNINKALGEPYHPTYFEWKELGGDHEAFVHDGFNLSVVDNGPDKYLWVVTRYGPADDVESGKKAAERVARGEE